jgi:hypothetical protein
VHTRGTTIEKCEKLEDFLAEFQLTNLPNTQKPVNIEALNQLKAHVIDRVNQEVLLEKKHFDEQMQPKLQEQLQSLKALRGKQQAQLELALERKLENVRASERQKKTRYLDNVFEGYERWVQDTWQTEPQPYIQLIAVIARAQETGSN